MVTRVTLPYEVLEIDGSAAYCELSIQSTAYDELEIEGAVLAAELDLYTGYIPTGTEPIFLISRNADEQLISREADALLVSRRSS